MTLHKTIPFVFSALIASLIGCRHLDTGGKATKEPDSLQLISLTPAAYTLLSSHAIDLDLDSAKEYALYFKTNIPTTCDNEEFTNCFVNELVIVKNIDEQWTKQYRFFIQNPLPADSATHLFIHFDKFYLLSITSSHRPTCCSDINTTQYFHFDNDTFG